MIRLTKWLFSLQVPRGELEGEGETPAWDWQRIKHEIMRRRGENGTRGGLSESMGALLNTWNLMAGTGAAGLAIYQEKGCLQANAITLWNMIAYSKAGICQALKWEVA